MQISAQSGAFARALSIVTRAASKKSTVPVLCAVLVEAAEGVISFKATDVEMSISLRSGADIKEEGSAAIPARMLNDIVSRLAEGPLTLATGDHGATLSTATSSYTLRTYEPSEFPTLPRFDPDAAFSIPSKELSGAISRASAAVSSDEQRPILCGLLTSFSGGKLEMASTDSYRLALYRSTLQGGPEEASSAVIPARALTEVSRLADMNDTVEVMLTENAAMFKIASVVISTRLVDGNFPDYSKLLPEHFAKEFDVPAAQLADTLKRVNLFSGATAGKSSKGGSPGAPVRFAFAPAGGSLSGGTLTVSSQSADVGGATETLDATVPEELDGSEYVIAFNGNYIADGVAQVMAFGSDTVRLRANEPLKPAVLTPAPKQETSGQDSTTAEGPTQQQEEQPAAAQQPEYVYLIMPMRDPDAEASASTAGATSH